jgi:hypothetical protein
MFNAAAVTQQRDGKPMQIGGSRADFEAIVARSSEQAQESGIVSRTSARLGKKGKTNRLSSIN